MKKFLCVLVLVCVVSASAWADVAINAQNFPDATFREYVRREFDYDNDGVLTDADLASFGWINVNSMDVSSLQGIEHFTGLQGLACQNNNLTELDLHNNTQIREIWAQNNHLPSINLSGLTALERIGLHSNDLTALDMSSFTNLIELHCGDNPLASLTLGNKPALTRLYVYRDQLNTLDVSQCPALEELHFGGNNITAIDVSNCPSLWYLHCWDNHLSTLDLSSCPAMVDLNCGGNNITTLTLGSHPNLMNLICWYNQIRTLNVANCPDLRSIVCQFNQIETLDVTNCPNLTYLGAGNNRLTALDISHNTHLKTLNINNEIDGSNNDGSYHFLTSYPQDKLTSLNTSNNTELEELYIDGNEISSLYLNNNRSLRRLNCMSNNISTLDVSYCPNMESLLVGENNLTELNTSQLTELVSLDVSGNNITAGDFSNNRKLRFLCYNATHIKNADVSQNTALVDLRFWSTDLEALDVRNCSQLEILHVHDSNVSTLTLGNHPRLRELACSRNNIETLDVTGCQALISLRCAHNKLTTLNVTGCSALEYIQCNDNWITALDLSSCTALVELNCDENSLSALNVSGCTSLRELRCYDNAIDTLDLSRNTALQFLDCSYNNLASLTLGSNSNLTHLECDNNNLSALNVSGLPALTYLNFRGNYVTDIDLSRNTALVELVCYINQLENLDLSHNTNLAILECRHNSLAALDLAGNSSLNDDALLIRRQIIRDMDITYHADNEEYPYHLDLTKYVPQEKLSNVYESSVKALNTEDIEIDSVYADGVLQASVYPKLVMYNYNTGRGRSMDVIITTEEIVSEDRTPRKASLNNHVYQIIPERMTWQDAKEHCEELGGHLLTINSSEEYSMIEDLQAEAFTIMRKDYTNSTFWVGAEWVNGALQWLDGEDITGWTSGRNGYVTITYMGNFYIPYTSSTVARYFICEWEQASADFAPEAPEYTRYIENPDEYFTGNDFFGAVPEQVDLSHLADNPPNVDEAEGAFHSSALSSRYDPRASGLLPSVKRQNPYDTCWSFASLGALETSYNVLNNRANAPDLSELYQAWFVFRDPRRGYSFELNDANKPLLNQGGDNSKAIAFLSHSGTARESDLPYTSAANIESLTAGKTPDNYAHPLRLREALRIGNITESNREAVKNLIMRYGAVSIAYYHNDNVSLTQNAYYLETAQNFGHAVCIVGWDDDYSASSFKNNGAWLAKNSWGEDFGDGGYFWLSYEQSIGDGAVFIADDSSDSLTLKGYDVLTDTGRIDYHWSANVFIAEGTEHAREVAFHTTDNNVPYEVYINRLGKDRPSNPGTPTTAIESGTMPYAGYHTITLREPIEIEDGEYFSVIVRLGTSSTYQYASAVEDTGAFYAASVRAGESYFAKDDTMPSESDWKDGMSITDNGMPRACNACIKVFVSAPEPEPEPEPEPAPTESEDRATPVAPQAGDSSGGGGGCSSTSLPALSMMLLAFVALRKTR